MKLRAKVVTAGMLALSMLALFAGTAFAAVDTDAVALVTSTGADVQDTVLAIIPVVLGIVLAVGLALWGIRYVLRKFSIRTSG